MVVVQIAHSVVYQPISKSVLKYVINPGQAE